MRPKTKAKPITIRLYIEEQKRVEEVFVRFKDRYAFADLSKMLRVWLGLPVEFSGAMLTDDERDYLSGRSRTLGAKVQENAGRPKIRVRPFNK